MTDIRKVTLKYLSPEGTVTKDWTLAPADKFGYDLAFKVGDSSFLKAYFGSYTYLLPLTLFVSLELDL